MKTKTIKNSKNTKQPSKNASTVRQAAKPKSVAVPARQVGDRNTASRKATLPPKGSLQLDMFMKLKGREFVKDSLGDWHEVDKNGDLIPDHLVKPI